MLTPLMIWLTLSLVIAELLGISQPDQDRFRVWTDACVEFITPLHSRLHVI
ncbi:hypothetical protein [Thermosporothrix hazakensis]|jgi:hypothetical protein|uniref:hypothetical protein n=1 Tax=Thermosporothrix hazakensis TaxID=644383 RepID=UPI0014761401|nr:hypothetical protein [Thermosporothrix hazakensis]